MAGAAVVARAQVPMIFTFDGAEVEYVVESLAASLEMAYSVISMFQDFDEGEEEW